MVSRAFGLSQQLGIEPSEAKQFIQAYFERYSGVQRFIDRTLDEARRDGRVKTLFGRMRPIPDINSKNANQRGFAERTAVNTPLQGTAADLIKLAMIRIDNEMRERKMRSRMTLQVHDELVFDVLESEVDAVKTLVREHMENVHKLDVPLPVEMAVGELARLGISLRNELATYFGRYRLFQDPPMMQFVSRDDVADSADRHFQLVRHSTSQPLISRQVSE